jgi:hypothetical protein
MLDPKRSAPPEQSLHTRHGRSFPIEIGIADDRGTRAWLIRPRPEWRDWGWTAQAERLHGLSRDVLDRDGLPADQVAAELAEAVHGRPLVADSVLDDYWLNLLAPAATRGDLPPLLQVGDVMAGLGTTDAEIEGACAALSAEPFHRHHAAEDARWLYRLLGALHAASAARVVAGGDRPLFPWHTDITTQRIPSTESAVDTFDPTVIGLPRRCARCLPTAT